MRKNNYTLQQIKKNLTRFNNKIIDKNLDTNFWIIVDRADFKPLKRIINTKNKEIKVNIHSIKEIRDNILDEKGEYYKEKKFSDIKITIDEDILEQINDIKEYKNLKNKILLFVHIIIYPIDTNGELDIENKWELKVKYFIDDFRNINFKLKNIEVLMRLVADNIVSTKSANGISYKNLSVKIDKDKDKKNDR
jgi:hypothetical protein